MALTVKQRGVLKGIIVGATITFVVIVGAILAGPMLLSPEATAGNASPLRCGQTLLSRSGWGYPLVRWHDTDSSLRRISTAAGSLTAQKPRTFCNPHFKTRWNRRFWRCWCIWRGQF